MLGGGSSRPIGIGRPPSRNNSNISTSSNTSQSYNPISSPLSYEQLIFRREKTQEGYILVRYTYADKVSSTFNKSLDTPGWKLRYGVLSMQTGILNLYIPKSPNAPLLKKANEYSHSHQLPLISSLSLNESNHHGTFLESLSVKGFIKSRFSHQVSTVATDGTQVGSSISASTSSNELDLEFTITCVPNTNSHLPTTSNHASAASSGLARNPTLSRDHIDTDVIHTSSTALDLASLQESDAITFPAATTIKRLKLKAIDASSLSEWLFALQKLVASQINVVLSTSSPNMPPMIDSNNQGILFDDLTESSFGISIDKEKEDNQRDLGQWNPRHVASSYVPSSSFMLTSFNKAGKLQTLPPILKSKELVALSEADEASSSSPITPLSFTGIAEAPDSYASQSHMARKESVSSTKSVASSNSSSSLSDREESRTVKRGDDGYLDVFGGLEEDAEEKGSSVSASSSVLTKDDQLSTERAHNSQGSSKLSEGFTPAASIIESISTTSSAVDSRQVLVSEVSIPTPTPTTTTMEDLKTLVGAFALQGHRRTMEDAHIYQLLDHGIEYYAIFDGHCGDTTAIKASQRLHKLIASDADYPLNLPISLQRSFAQFDKELLEEVGTCSSAANSSGSTALVGLFHRQSRMLTIACLGDSRPVLATPSTSRQGVPASGFEVVPLTQERTPLSEQSRILEAGGWVLIEEEFTIARAHVIDHSDPFVRARANEKAGRKLTVSRVNGELAVSRAFGDPDYKGAHRMNSYDWFYPSWIPMDQRTSNRFSKGDLILSEPDVVQIQPVPSNSFLILACDGLWESLTNEEVVNLASTYLFQEMNTPAQTAERLAQMAIKCGSSDNVSVIVVLFP
jgi:serine/threonine protein phosphatase PrpC